MENRLKFHVVCFAIDMHALLLPILPNGFWPAQVNTKDHKLWDIRRRCAGHFFKAGKHNAYKLNILVHLQLLCACAQRGKELEFSWWVKSSSKQLLKAHS